MPPDASSRSRTYLPKTWGNNVAAHGTVLLAALLGCACTTVPGAERTHPVRAHFLPACAPAKTSGSTEFDIEALGDFDPSADTGEVLSESDGSQKLVVPGTTRAVVVTATDGFSNFEGSAAAGVDGSIDVSLWPQGTSCDLSLGAAYPGSAGGQAIGVAPDGRTLLVAGGEGENEIATAALAVDFETGTVAAVSSDDGLRKRRSGATVTPFGADLLVAGGVDPEDGTALDSADVFDPEARSFAPDLVMLESPRSHHAAVVLDSGETLLVGGTDGSGRALRTLEAISPVSREYRISNLADLATQRVDGVALRLSDGRILVASGTDESGAPLQTLELLSADASTDQPLPSLASEGDPDAFVVGRAFAAMPGGGALAVGGCRDANASAPACAAPSPSVRWITPEGTVDSLPDLDDVVAAWPTLIAGEEGRPWLAATSAADGSPVLRRFDPWSGRFVTDDAPTPPSVATNARYFSIDDGLFAWFATDPTAGVSLSGFRHGTRGPYVDAVTPLLQTTTDGISPDRALGTVVSRDPATGTVTLAPPGALVITDATYADVHLVIGVTAGAPPLIRLDQGVFGSGACAWPVTPAPPFDADFLRSNTTVTLSLAGRSRSCGTTSGRTAVSIAPNGDSIALKSVTVTRDIPR